MTIHLNKIFSIVLSASFLCGQIATAQSNSSQITASKWQTLNRNNYSVKYPADWDLQQSDNKETGTIVNATVRYQFAVLSQLESPQDQFRENVNLVIEDLDGKKLDLDEYSRLAENQLKTMMKNCKILEQKKVNKGVRPYFKIIWTWDYQTVPLKVEQYTWLLDGKAYILTFTSEQTKFAQFQQVGEKILDTFTLKK
jgi:Ni/Co efflux regulator RcnB